VIQRSGDVNPAVVDVVTHSAGQRKTLSFSEEVPVPAHTNGGAGDRGPAERAREARCTRRVRLSYQKIEHLNCSALAPPSIRGPRAISRSILLRQAGSGAPADIFTLEKAHAKLKLEAIEGYVPDSVRNLFAAIEELRPDCADFLIFCARHRHVARPRRWLWARRLRLPGRHSTTPASRWRGHESDRRDGMHSTNRRHRIAIIKAYFGESHKPRHREGYRGSPILNGEKPKQFEDAARRVGLHRLTGEMSPREKPRYGVGWAPRRGVRVEEDRLRGRRSRAGSKLPNQESRRRGAPRTKWLR